MLAVPNATTATRQDFALVNTELPDQLNPLLAQSRMMFTAHTHLWLLNDVCSASAAVRPFAAQPQELAWFL